MKISLAACLILIGIAFASNSERAGSNNSVTLQPTTQSDGGPIVLCRPGHPCDPDDQ